MIDQYDKAIQSLLERVCKSTPGDSAEAIKALCEGISILEQAKIYATARVVTEESTEQLLAVALGAGDGTLN